MPAGIIACFRPLTDASLFLVLYGAAAVYFSGVMVRAFVTASSDNHECHFECERCAQLVCSCVGLCLAPALPALPFALSGHSEGRHNAVCRPFTGSHGVSCGDASPILQISFVAL
jgi:hypothetical protein